MRLPNLSADTECWLISQGIDLTSSFGTAGAAIRKMRPLAGYPVWLLRSFFSISAVRSDPVATRKIIPAARALTYSSSIRSLLRVVHGVDGRANAGYGLWQLAFGSKAELMPANYEAPRAAMMAFKGDEGRPLNIRPNVLVAPPSLEGAARQCASSATAPELRSSARTTRRSRSRTNGRAPPSRSSRHGRLDGCPSPLLPLERRSARHRGG